MSLLDYLIMLIYFAVMIGAGYWGLTRARNADDYLVAGRHVVAWRHGNACRPRGPVVSRIRGGQQGQRTDIRDRTAHAS